MQDSLPAGGLRLYREGVEPSGSHRKVSGYISILLSRTSPDARVVYAKPPFAGPAAVLAYLSRYTHRVAISNRRLIDFNEAGVTFRYKDYRRKGSDRQQVMTLDPNEFIRRFLLHVLPRGFHRIRHYGLLAGATRKSSLALARKLLAVASPPDDDDMSEEPLDTRSPCPCCGGHMLVIETFASWCQPRAPPHGAASTGRNAP
jgi:hypothetical protein